MTDRIDLAFHAETADDAMRQAREWAHAEPHIRLRTIASCRRVTHDDGHPQGDRWTVTVVVVART